MIESWPSCVVKTVIVKDKAKQVLKKPVKE